MMEGYDLREDEAVEARVEGKYAYREGAKECPYSPGTPEARYWRAGWLAARDREGE